MVLGILINKSQEILGVYSSLIKFDLDFSPSWKGMMTDGFKLRMMGEPIKEHMINSLIYSFKK